MTTTKNPEKTRQGLITAAFHEIHENGFRAASLDRILEKTGLTKGALYYYFPTKKELGFAVLEDFIQPTIHQQWITPINETNDPIATLISLMKQKGNDQEELRCGCPLNNLAQEMSSVDEGFRKRIQHIFKEWSEAVIRALERGQAQGNVDSNVNPQQVATFLVACIEGSASLSKNTRQIDTVECCRQGLSDYLNSLRPKTKEE